MPHTHHRRHPHTAAHRAKTLSFATHVDHFGDAPSLLERERDRLAKFQAGLSPHGPLARSDPSIRALLAAAQPFSAARGKGSSGADPDGSGTSIDVTNAAVTYTTQVGVGSPATDYTLLIDTGSSNTWVGADKKYVKTSTSKSTGKSVQVSYGSGSFSGTEFTDTVTLAPELVIEKQSIGVASEAQDFQGVDGIVGIGPVDLTQGTVKGSTTVPTVTDNLFSQGTIAVESIGISYTPSTGSNADSLPQGELTFGGVDPTKETGELVSVPITSQSPASAYWGIDQTVTYGSGSDAPVILNNAPGIVDTGTTLFYLPSDGFQTYQQATGATLDQTTGLLKLTQSQYNKLESLFFNIGGSTFEWTKNAQIWPRALNAQLGGDADSIYLVAADSGTNSGSGLDFINGMVWLQRFYSVFDTTNAQLQFATTSFTDAETN